MTSSKFWSDLQNCMEPSAFRLISIQLPESLVRKIESSILTPPEAAFVFSQLVKVSGTTSLTSIFSRLSSLSRPREEPTNQDFDSLRKSVEIAQKEILKIKNNLAFKKTSLRESFDVEEIMKRFEIFESVNSTPKRKSGRPKNIKMDTSVILLHNELSLFKYDKAKLSISDTPEALIELTDSKSEGDGFISLTPTRLSIFLLALVHVRIPEKFLVGHFHSAKRNSFLSKTKSLKRMSKNIKLDQAQSEAPSSSTN